jgi:transcriptional regulator with XRE-family HTH domain
MDGVLIRPDSAASDTADLVRSLRGRAGLTQGQLAERLATSQSVVSRWESGRDEPRLTTLARLARACGESLLVTTQPDDVDRAQIREHLDLTPAQRLAALRNVNRFVATARRVRGGT